MFTRPEKPYTTSTTCQLAAAEKRSVAQWWKLQAVPTWHLGWSYILILHFGQANSNHCWMPNNSKHTIKDHLDFCNFVIAFFRSLFLSCSWEFFGLCLTVNSADDRRMGQMELTPGCHDTRLRQTLTPTHVWGWPCLTLACPMSIFLSFCNLAAISAATDWLLQSVTNW